MSKTKTAAAGPNPRHAPIPLPTKEEVDAARASAKKLIEKARAYIILDHPFFATIMLKHPMIETAQVPTLAVSPRGDILYNPFFVAGRPVDEVVFGICHEIMHYASNHSGRVGNRDRRKWNYAGDMWINDTLRDAGFKIIEGCINVPGSKDRTVEDIYASLPDGDGGGGQGQQGGQGGNGTNDQGQGDGNGNGDGNDPIGEDMQHGEKPSESEQQEIDAQRKIEVAEAAQVAKMKGKLPGQLAKFAAETVQSKTPWHEILERYMTEHKQTDQSWAKPNRRYMPSYYMPNKDSEDAMGEIVCQVDISGSISKQEIAHYNGHMKRIIEQCRPEKVHVIYTDTQVQKHEVFDKPDELEIRFYSGGGTDMTAGIDYVHEHDIDPAVFVTLTDGYTPYPDSAPDFPTVWCISSKGNDSPVGVNVHFELES